MLSDPDSEADVESIWTGIKPCLSNACDSVCGWTKGNCKQERETWWWDETVESLLKQKWKLWKEWQKGGSKDKYLEAKRKAKSGVYAAKRKAQEEKFSQLKRSDGKIFIFKLAERMKRENQYIGGDKCVKNDEGCLTYYDHAKLKA